MRSNAEMLNTEEEKRANCKCNKTNAHATLCAIFQNHNQPMAMIGTIIFIVGALKCRANIS